MIEILPYLIQLIVNPAKRIDFLKKIIASLSAFIILFSGSALFLFSKTCAQSAANYSVTRSTGITYNSISGSGNNFSTWRSGAAQYGNRTDGTESIGFDFWYLGTRFTNFSISTSGYLDFSSSIADGSGTGAFGYNNAKFSDNTALTSVALAAFYNSYLRAGTATLNNHFKYLTSGTAPNRVLTVEWISCDGYKFSGPSQWSTTSDYNFQVKLYETTGIIEFIYGSMTIGTSEPSYTSGINAATQSATATAAELLCQQTANTTTFGNTEINNLSSLPANTSKITLTSPQNPTVPSALSFSAITTSGMTLNWTDNSSNENGFAIFRSVDNVTFEYVTRTAANAVSYPASGLLCGTTYYWRVFSVTEGCLSSTALTGSQATTAGPAPGTYSVGPTGNYASIGSAITAISCAPITGAYIFELQSTYSSAVEAFPLTISAIAGANNVNTITIRPAAGAAGLSIASSNTTGTLNFNGSYYVIFDGRLGGAGAKDMTISNTSTTGYAVQFTGDASYNTVKYGKVYGVNTTTTEGVILFGSGANSGNDANTIDNCDIGDGASTPVNCIYATGTATVFDDNNIISNNNIYNFFGASSHNGINIQSDNTDWTISGNSFYQTATRTGAAGLVCRAIYINNSSGNNFSVTGNYIGGQSANAGGSPWTISTASSATYTFIGIDVNVGTTTTSSIQTNTIQNFSWNTSSTTSTGPGVWCAVNITGGNVNIGTTSGNTIGSGTGTGSITSRSTATGSSLNAINSSSTGTVNISNNTIGSITTTGSGTTISHGINGILVSGASGTYTISGNTIGSTSSANSIDASSASTSATAQKVAGISSSNAGTVTISNNTIANIYNAFTTAITSNSFVGIETTAGTNTISTNTIHDLTTPNMSEGIYPNAPLIGIKQISTAAAIQTIDHNTIYNLVDNDVTNAAITVTGIYFTGATSVTSKIYQNTIYSLSTTSTNATVFVEGIAFNGGSADYTNNIIRMGYDANGNSQNTSFPIWGIDHGSSATSTNNIYYNSIYVGGSPVAAGTAYSYCYRRAATSGTTNVKNNIFFNARSNGASTGTHYAIRIAATTGLTSNYNVLYISGTGGCISNAAAGCTFLNWQSLGFDANSYNVDPGFKNPTGSSATMDLHISETNCNVADKGTPINGITTDNDDDSRYDGTLGPDIGADEFSGSINVGSAGSAACTGASTTLIPTYTGSPTSYLWQESSSNSPYSWAAAPGTNNTANYTTPALASTKYYRVQVTNGGCTNNSNAVGITIYPAVPAAPGSISGTTDPCLNTTGNVYSIAAVPNTQTYNWTVPAGATITSGSGTNSITVTVGTASGNISVTASNPCGTSAASTLAITVGGAGTWSGKTNTLWSVASNWCGNAVPTSATDVIVPNVTNKPVIDNSVSGGFAACRDLTINSGSSLTVKNTLNSCNGNGWGVILNGAGYLKIYGNLVNNGTFYHQNANSSKSCLLFNYLMGSGKTISGTGSYPAWNTFAGPGFLVDNGASYTLTASWPYISSERFASIYINTSGSVTLDSYTLTTYGFDQFGTINLNTGTVKIGFGLPTLTNANFNEGTGKIVFEANSGGYHAWMGQYSMTFYNVTSATSGGYKCYLYNSNVEINGDFTINAGSVFEPYNASEFNVNLAGNWINGGTFTAGTGSATVIFDGTSSQSIGGTSSSVFNNLTINNTITGAGGVTVNTNSTINNLLTLTDGHLISPASGRLTMGTAATVSPSSATGSGQAGSFVSGFLDRVLNTSGTNYDFPLGDSPSGTWRPITLTAKDATSRTWTAEFVKNDPIAVYGSDIVSGEALKGMNNIYYYNLTRSPSTGSVDIKMWYDPTDQNVAESEIIIGHWCDAPCGASKWDNWSKNDMTPGTNWNWDAGNNWIQGLNIGTFSPIGPGRKSFPLPIELLLFTAFAASDIIHLKWNTASEINNDEFIIERSKDGIEFKKIAVIKSKAPGGTSSTIINYSTVDENPYRGISYYRLKQTDLDGKYSYSDVVAVDITEGSRNLYVYPNPAIHKLNIWLDRVEKSSVKITDLTGKVVYENFQIIQSNGIFPVDISSFAKGVYFVSLSDGIDTRYARFVKE